MNTTAIAVRGLSHHSTAPGGLRRVARALGEESGAATAEYAIATLAAVGFAGLLVVILRGDEIKGMLTDIIHRALSISI
jgi:Flp pilus assembly pilin Flp